MQNLKKISLIIISALMICILANANSYATELVCVDTEISADFLEWLELSDEEKANTVMPTIYELPSSRYVLSFENSIFTKSFETVVKAYSSKFSLKDEIEIRVKNQKDTGECWAFAMTSALETTATKAEGKLSDEYSPRHMDYSCTREFLNNQIYENGFNRKLGTGGTMLNGLSYYASGQGPILETDMKFENNENKINISKIKNKTVQKHVEGARLFTPIYKTKNSSGITYYSNSSRTEELSNSKVSEIRTEIKNHIKEYGGIYAIVKSTVENKNYNSKTAALYQEDDSDLTAVHAVTIIGWDDNYSKNNFANKPLNDGAYICLNSYGTNVGKDGYIYVSYEDAFIEINLCGITEVEDKDFDIIYQYDELGCSTYIGYLNEVVYAQNIYTRTLTNDTEYLNEVGTYIITDTEVEVYVDPTGEITDCSEMIKPKLENVNGKLKYGYHVLKFAEPIKLTGESFKVIIKYKKDANSEIVTVPAEASKTNTVYEYAYVSNNSYVSADGSYWQAFCNIDGEPYDATIKAFTTYQKNIEPTGINLNKTSARLYLDENTTFKLNATVLPETANYKNKVAWTSNNENIAEVNDGEVTLKSAGEVTIVAETANKKVAECTLIIRDTRTFSVKSEKYDVDDSNLSIKYIPLETNYLEFQNDIVATSDYKIYDVENNEVTSGIMKTGYKIKSEEGEEEYIVSVIGDPSGDGKLNLVDLMKMRLHYVGKKGYILDEIYESALDLNGDKIFNLVDCNHLVRKYLSK